MSNQRRLNKSSDVIHAVALLIAAPIVFGFGYLLISETMETTIGLEDNQETSVPAFKEANKLGEYVVKIIQPGPPPGEAWLTEVDRLKTQLEATQVAIANETVKANAIETLLQIQQHISENMHNMPEIVTDASPLGEHLAHIAYQARKLQNKKLTLPEFNSLERGYETELRNQRNQDEMAISERLKPMLDEQSTIYQSELSSLTRKIHTTSNTLQQISNETQTVERETRNTIDSVQRRQKFARDQADIELLLGPFTTPAYVQLGSGYTDWRKVSEKQPISFSKLEACGALENNIKGVRTLLYIARPAYGTKPYGARPTGAFPQDLRSATSMEKVKRAQQLIREHSVYLIESGLLHP